MVKWNSDSSCLRGRRIGGAGNPAAPLQAGELLRDCLLTWPLPKRSLPWCFWGPGVRSFTLPVSLPSHRPRAPFPAPSPGTPGLAPLAGPGGPRCPALSSLQAFHRASPLPKPPSWRSLCLGLALHVCDPSSPSSFPPLLSGGTFTLLNSALSTPLVFKGLSPSLLSPLRGRQTAFIACSQGRCEELRRPWLIE